MNRYLTGSIICVFGFLAVDVLIPHRSDHSNDIGHDQVKPEWTSDKHWYRTVRRGGTIDPNEVTKSRKKAKEFVRKNKTYTTKDGGIIDWDWRGPGNIGGRIRAIALQPDGMGGENIFIGAASGGIWRSIDNGQSWTPMDDFAPSLAVTSIVVDPNDSNVLYASTGEGLTAGTMGIPGAGIFKSADGGTTWNQLLATANSQFYWVNKVAVNPHNSNHLLAVTSFLNLDGLTGISANGGGFIKESVDGGITWSNVGPQTSEMTDIDFHPTDPDRIIVSGYRTLRVYNPNTGNYDEKVTSGLDELETWTGRIEVAISASDPDVIYALQNSRNAGIEAYIYKSTNGGQTWSDPPLRHADVFTGPSFGNYSNTIWVDPCNSEHIYLGGLDLWKSTDSGASITKISTWSSYEDFVNIGVRENSQIHADQHIIVPSLNYSDTNKKIYIGNDGGIQKTDNISTASDNISGSSGWDNLAGTSLGITQLYSAAISPSNGQLAGGSQDNGILFFDKFISGSGDPIWRQPSTGDCAVVAFHPHYPNRVYASINYGWLHMSIDSGRTFQDTFQLGKDESPLIGAMVVNPHILTPDEVYLGGRSLWWFNTSTNTSTIVKPVLPDSSFISSLYINPLGNVFWVGYENGVVEKGQVSGGVYEWSGDITTSSQIPNTCVTDIAVYNTLSGSNKDEILISFGGYSQSNIWKYETDGNTDQFYNRSLEFAMQVNSITYHPVVDDFLYIGTDVGVFASEDEGLNWSMTPLNSGSSNASLNNEGPVFTEVSDLFWGYDNFGGGYAMYAATFGRGLWVTDDSQGFSGIVLDTIFIDPMSNVTWKFGTRTNPFRILDQALYNRIGDTGVVVKFLNGGFGDLCNLVLDKRLTIITESGSVIFCSS